MGKECGPIRRVVFTGPSGAGKDEVMKILLDRLGEKAEKVVTYTTRKPRAGEVDGWDYHFVPTEEFLRMQDEGRFGDVVQYRIDAETDEIDWKGTLKEDMEFKEGKILFWRIDPGRAAEEAAKANPETVVVYVGVERLAVLRDRAKKRGDFDKKKFAKTLKKDWETWKANEEVFKSHAKIVVNREGKLDEAVEEVWDLIRR